MLFLITALQGALILLDTILILLLGNYIFLCIVAMLDLLFSYLELSRYPAYLKQVSKIIDCHTHALHYYYFTQYKKTVYLQACWLMRYFFIIFLDMVFWHMFLKAIAFWTTFGQFIKIWQSFFYSWKNKIMPFASFVYATKY